MEARDPARVSLRGVFKIIFKRKHSILLFFFTTVAAAAAAAFIIKPTYESSAQILVKVGRESVYMPTMAKGTPIINMNRQEEQINSEIEILKSMSLAEKVVASLGAKTIYPDIEAEAVSDEDTGGSPEQKAVIKFLKNLSVWGVRKSNVIAVRFVHHDRHLAAKVLNTMVKEYLERHLVVHKTPQSLDFFQRQSEILQSRLSRSEATLQALKQQHDVTELKEQQNLLLRQVADARAALNTALTEEAEIQNRIQLLATQLDSVPQNIAQGEEVNQNPYLISTLETRLMELKLKEKDLLSKYTDESRLVQSVKDEIAMVEKKLNEQEAKRYDNKRSGINPVHQTLQQELLRGRADLKAVKAKIASQTDQLASYRNELDELDKIEVTYNQMRQEVEQDRQNHQLYLSKYEESRISDAMDSEKITSVSLAEPAHVPLKPVSPNKTLYLALALLLGSLGGLTFAFLAELLDDRLEDIDEIEAVLQLPVLASIPEMAKNS
ncbi:MAG: hypothetical protein C4530_24465 [Desulfobacteraceae bacterium]|nr:MAG: hypothetical protein C4530_24465 [Desulfobacteraceae bacterium]